MPDATYNELDKRLREIENDFRAASEIDTRFRAIDAKIATMETNLATGQVHFEAIREKLKLLDEINRKVGSVNNFNNRLEKLEASKVWLSRLVIGGVVAAVMAALTAGKFAA